MLALRQHPSQSMLIGVSQNRFVVCFIKAPHLKNAGSTTVPKLSAFRASHGLWNAPRNHEAYSLNPAGFLCGRFASSTTRRAHPPHQPLSDDNRKRLGNFV